MWTEILIAIAIVVVLGVLWQMWSRRPATVAPAVPERFTEEYFTEGLDMTPSTSASMSVSSPSAAWEVPAFNQFAPIRTQPSDVRYVYSDDDDVWLLPYDNLDFNIPQNRWMYYYYPNFYRRYYTQFWPWGYWGAPGGNLSFYPYRGARYWGRYPWGRRGWGWRGWRGYPGRRWGGRSWGGRRTGYGGRSFGGSRSFRGSRSGGRGRR